MSAQGVTQDIILACPVRTAIGAYNGSLKGTPAPDLGAVVVRETLRRAGLDAAAVGSVVIGNVIQAGNKMNPARQAAIGGGVPVSVPALTVNRVCGSGAQAVVTAAQQIMSGEIDVAVAGGMENMDRAPYLMDKGIEAFATGEAPRPDTTVEVLAKLRPAFRDTGTITAGNAPGLNRGAAAMIVASRAFTEA
jgi:acetyl-CoA C-acetyltransferase